MKLRHFLLTALCFWTGSYCYSAEIDDSIIQAMDEGGIMGLGAALIVDKEVVWMKGYGFADKQRAVPFTPDTVINIGSISKTFVGAALMRAVEEGRLSLDEDINTYLPFKVVNPYYPDATITLRHLATHISGIDDNWSIYKDTYHYGGNPVEPLGEFMMDYLTPSGRFYSNQNYVNFLPGTHREYSNIGADLAGYIIEVVMGEKLNSYLKRQFFAPLEMNNTGLFLSEIAPGSHATLYVAQDGLTVPILPYELTAYPGSVRTSVSDLSKFFIALLNEGEYQGTRILEMDSAEEMLKFQYSDASKPDNVNLRGENSENSGIFWGTRFDITRIGHNGSDPGIRTMMLSDLAKETGVILFSNTSMTGEDMRHLVGIYFELWEHAEALKTHD